jgi:hypothetical protein
MQLLGYPSVWIVRFRERSNSGPFVDVDIGLNHQAWRTIPAVNHIWMLDDLSTRSDQVETFPYLAASILGLFYNHCEAVDSSVLCVASDSPPVADDEALVVDEVEVSSSLGRAGVSTPDRAGERACWFLGTTSS